MRCATLALCLLSTAALAAPPRRTQTSGRSMIRALGTLGYSPLVARKMVTLAPKVARKVVSRRSRPVLLYRGMDIEPSSFNPRFVSTDPVGKTCMTDSPRFAVGYAVGYPETRLRNGERHGVMLELQIPRMLLDDPRSKLVFKVDTSRAPDLTPFMKRMGVLDLGRLKYTRDGDVDEARAVRSIKWTAAKQPAR